MHGASSPLPTLQFNMVMHLNDKFEDAHNNLRNDLLSWRENVDAMKQQSLEWERSALKEQDRVRQEYSLMVAQGESDNQKMRANQTMRQSLLNIQATIELLNEELSETEWLMNILEDHIKMNSSFLSNSWAG